MVKLILFVLIGILEIKSSSAEIINDSYLGRNRSVLEYGAKGDGQQDDSEAFQNAINSMKENDQLFIPKGTYLITRTLRVNKVNVKIYGDGKTSKLVYRYGRYSQTKSVIQAFLLEKASNVTFSNFSVNGGATVFDNTRIDDYGKEVWDVYGAYNIFFIHPSYDNAVNNIIFRDLDLSHSYFSAIHCYGRLKDPWPKFYSSNLSIENCTFTDIGIHAIGFNYTHNSLVKGNNIKDVGLAKLIKDSGSGLGVDASAGCESIIVENNIIDGAGGGIKCETHKEDNGKIVTSKNIVIRNNTIKNLYGEGRKGYDIFYGIRVNGDNCIIEGNDIESFSHGILIGLNAKSSLIQNNIIRSTKSKMAAGIRCDKNGGGHQIIGNTVKNTGAQGILISNSFNINIANNIVINSNLDNIRILGGNGITIRDNICGSAGTNNISVFPTTGMKISDVSLENNICYDLDGTVRDASRRILVKNANNIKEFNNKIQVAENKLKMESNVDVGQLEISTTFPKTGSYQKGDFIIKKHVSTKMALDDSIIGWRCIESGKPGKWRSVSINKR